MDTYQTENSTPKKQELILEARHSRSIEAANKLRSKLKSRLFIPRTPPEIYKYSSTIPRNQPKFFANTLYSKDFKIDEHKFVKYIGEVPKSSISNEENINTKSFKTQNEFKPKSTQNLSKHKSQLNKIDSKTINKTRKKLHNIYQLHVNYHKMEVKQKTQNNSNIDIAQKKLERNQGMEDLLISLGLDKPANMSCLKVIQIKKVIQKPSTENGENVINNSKDLINNDHIEKTLTTMGLETADNYKKLDVTDLTTQLGIVQNSENTNEHLLNNSMDIPEIVENRIDLTSQHEVIQNSENTTESIFNISKYIAKSYADTIENLLNTSMNIQGTVENCIDLTSQHDVIQNSENTTENILNNSKDVAKNSADTTENLLNTSMDIQETVENCIYLTSQHDVIQNSDNTTENILNNSKDVAKNSADTTENLLNTSMDTQETVENCIDLTSQHDVIQNSDNTTEHILNNSKDVAKNSADTTENLLNTSMDIQETVENCIDLTSQHDVIQNSENTTESIFNISKYIAKSYANTIDNLLNTNMVTQETVENCIDLTSQHDVIQNSENTTENILNSSKDVAKNSADNTENLLNTSMDIQETVENRIDLTSQHDVIQNSENTTENILNNSKDVAKNSADTTEHLLNTSMDIQETVGNDGIQNSESRTKNLVNTSMDIQENLEENCIDLTSELDVLQSSKNTTENILNNYMDIPETVENCIDLTTQLDNLEYCPNSVDIILKDNEIHIKPLKHNTIKLAESSAKAKEDSLQILMETSEDIMRLNRKSLENQKFNKSMNSINSVGEIFQSAVKSKTKKTLENCIKLTNVPKSHLKTNENISKSSKNNSKFPKTINSSPKKNYLKSMSKEQNHPIKICDNKIVTNYNNIIHPCVKDFKDIVEQTISELNQYCDSTSADVEIATDLSFLESSINDFSTFLLQTCKDMDLMEETHKKNVEYFTKKHTSRLNDIQLSPADPISDESIGLTRISDMDQINPESSALLENSENLQPTLKEFCVQINAAEIPMKTIKFKTSEIKQMKNGPVETTLGFETVSPEEDWLIKDIKGETNSSSDTSDNLTSDKAATTVANQGQNDFQTLTEINDLNNEIGQSLNRENNNFHNDQNVLICSKKIDYKALMEQSLSNNAGNKLETITNSQISQTSTEILMPNTESDPKNDHKTQCQAIKTSKNTIDQIMKIDQQINEQSQIIEKSSETSLNTQPHTIKAPIETFGQRRLTDRPTSSEQLSERINQEMQIYSQDCTNRTHSYLKVLKPKLSESNINSTTTTIKTPSNRNDFSSIQQTSKQLTSETGQIYKSSKLNVQSRMQKRRSRSKTTKKRHATKKSSNQTGLRSTKQTSEELNHLPPPNIGKISQITKLDLKRQTQIQHKTSERTCDLITTPKEKYHAYLIYANQTDLSSFQHTSNQLNSQPAKICPTSKSIEIDSQMIHKKLQRTPDSITTTKEILETEENLPKETESETALKIGQTFQGIDLELQRQLQMESKRSDRSYNSIITAKEKYQTSLSIDPSLIPSQLDAQPLKIVSTAQTRDLKSQMKRKRKKSSSTNGSITIISQVHQKKMPQKPNSEYENSNSSFKNQSQLPQDHAATRDQFQTPHNLTTSDKNLNNSSTTILEQQILSSVTTPEHKALSHASHSETATPCFNQNQNSTSIQAIHKHSSFAPAQVHNTALISPREQSYSANNSSPNQAQNNNGMLRQLIERANPVSISNSEYLVQHQEQQQRVNSSTHPQFPEQQQSQHHAKNSLHSQAREQQLERANNFTNPPLNSVYRQDPTLELRSALNHQNRGYNSTNRLGPQQQHPPNISSHSQVREQQYRANNFTYMHGREQHRVNNSAHPSTNAVSKQNRTLEHQNPALLNSTHDQGPEQSEKHPANSYSHSQAREQHAYNSTYSPAQENYITNNSIQPPAKPSSKQNCATVLRSHDHQNPALLNSTHAQATAQPQQHPANNVSNSQTRTEQYYAHFQAREQQHRDNNSTHHKAKPVSKKDRTPEIRSAHEHQNPVVVNSQTPEQPQQHTANNFSHAHDQNQQYRANNYTHSQVREQQHRVNDSIHTPSNPNHNPEFRSTIEHKNRTYNLTHMHYLGETNSTLTHPQAQSPAYNTTHLSAPDNNPAFRFTLVKPNVSPNLHLLQSQSPIQDQNQLRQTQTRGHEPTLGNLLEQPNNLEVTHPPAYSSQHSPQYRNTVNKFSLPNQHPTYNSTLSMAQAQSRTIIPILEHQLVNSQLTGPPAYPSQHPPPYQNALDRSLHPAYNSTHAMTQAQNFALLEHQPSHRVKPVQQSPTQPQYPNPAIRYTLEHPHHVNPHHMHPHLLQNPNMIFRPSLGPQHPAHNINMPGFPLTPPAEDQIGSFPQPPQMSFISNLGLSHVPAKYQHTKSIFGKYLNYLEKVIISH